MKIFEISEKSIFGIKYCSKNIFDEKKESAQKIDLEYKFSCVSAYLWTRKRHFRQHEKN